jgi:hypothetical protein
MKLHVLYEVDGRLVRETALSEVARRKASAEVGRGRLSLCNPEKTAAMFFGSPIVGGGRAEIMDKARVRIRQTRSQWTDPPAEMFLVLGMLPKNPDAGV